MAGLIFDVNIPSTPITNNVAKTVVQVKAPANQRVEVLALNLSVDGTSGTSLPVRLRFVKQSSAGTSLVSATPHALDDEVLETIQSTCQVGSQTTQTEPTLVTTRETRLLSGFNGQLEVDKSSDLVPLFVLSGGTYLGVEALNPSGNPDMNISGFIRCRE